MCKYIEVEKSESTHTEITIGNHVDIFPNFVAEQYACVSAKRRYLIINKNVKKQQP